MAEFHKPPDRRPEQVMQSVMQLVNRAAERGQSEVQVYRFPNNLCTDRSVAEKLAVPAVVPPRLSDMTSSVLPPSAS